MLPFSVTHAPCGVMMLNAWSQHSYLLHFLQDSKISFKYLTKVMTLVALQHPNTPQVSVVVDDLKK